MSLQQSFWDVRTFWYELHFPYLPDTDRWTQNRVTLATFCGTGNLVLVKVITLNDTIFIMRYGVRVINLNQNR